MIGNSRKILTIFVTCFFCWIFGYLALDVFRDYAVGLFIWLPIVLGATSTMLYGYKNKTTRKESQFVSFVTLAVFCIGLLAFAFEGIICIIMAAPIGIFFTWIGHIIGYELIKNKIGSSPVTIVLLLLSVPAVMSFENSQENEKQIRAVTTSIEINATSEMVWKNVIAFPQLKPPTEFIFKTGIAYPIDARIDNYGVGAVRHCNFSTGSFVEPITVWDEPHLLKFDVAEQPEPMKELSFYDIHPNHLHGYFVSTQGQFKLTPLPNGHTLLEGTTWYYNKIKPGIYWTLWSDYIVHQIHERVLKHIKQQAEMSFSDNKRNK